MSPSEHSPLPTRGLTEQLGHAYGKLVIHPFLDALTDRVKLFDITTSGLDYLHALSTPHILVSNHTKPASAFSEQSGISPDAFVIQYVVQQASGISPKVIAKADYGWWYSNPWMRTLQEKTSPLMREAHITAGTIPINKNPGSINKEFVDLVGHAVQMGISILVFPQGSWYKDFDVTQPLSDGAAYLAQKFHLPIMPVYIYGADDWKRNQIVHIRFGKPFAPVGEEKQGRTQTTEAIRSAIEALRMQHAGQE